MYPHRGKRCVCVLYGWVSEAMNTNEEIFSEERLRSVIEQYAHLSPQLLQEKIVHAVSEFSGKAPQHDDFTMVVVKIRSK
jgi:serine phosphatase RsbU (regulator of sigma subunit)